MPTLVIAAHIDPRAAAPAFRAALPADVELCAFVQPGLSSAYRALAARLRRRGRVLPALLEHARASMPLGRYDRIVFLSWSAAYALAEELLLDPIDVASLSGWVALDSGYGEPTAGVIHLARRAREGRALYWAGFTDVPTTAYRSSAGFLAEVQRRSGEPAGLFRVAHWAHDPAAHKAAPDKGAFWRNEHVGALHRGPAFLVAALDALRHAAPPAANEARPVGSRRLDRAAVLELARAAHGARVHESPPGSNRGPEIDGYLYGCARAGRSLGILGVPWCAAFASWCLWRAAYGDEAEARALAWTSLGYFESGEGPPVGWRAAVAELVADARDTGTWHEVSEGGRPEPGDLLVMGRNGQDPRRWGAGHVAIVDEVVEGGGLYSIGGNESDAVRRTQHGASTLADRRGPILGWITIAGG